MEGDGDGMNEGDGGGGGEMTLKTSPLRLRLRRENSGASPVWRAPQVNSWDLVLIIYTSRVPGCRWIVSIYLGPGLGPQLSPGSHCPQLEETKYRQGAGGQLGNQACDHY